MHCANVLSYNVDAGDGKREGVEAATLAAEAELGPFAHVGVVEAAAFGDVALAAHVVLQAWGSIDNK